MSSTSSPRAATSVATSVLHLAGVEACECALALGLTLVAVNRNRVDVVAVQLLDEPVGACLRPHEHEHEPALLIQQIDERRDLGVRRHGNEAMVDIAGS